MKSSRPIGDKLARQIERHCDKSPGWLEKLFMTHAPGKMFVTDLKG